MSKPPDEITLAASCTRRERDLDAESRTIRQLIELLQERGGLSVHCEVAEAGPLGLRVDLTGADTALLTARNGELLHAIEHLAARTLRLDQDENELLVFEADDFKRNRDRDLHLAVEDALARVHATGRPFAFAPMSSRERRMVHLALARSGLRSASSSDGPRRFVVLYPEAGQVKDARVGDHS